MYALKQMGGCDVVHVEGWVLTQQHHIHPAQVLRAWVADLVVVTEPILDGKGRALRNQPAIQQAEVGRDIVEQLVPALLGLQQQGKGGIAADVDAVDRVHLAGNSERHALHSGAARGTVEDSCKLLPQPSSTANSVGYPRCGANVARDRVAGRTAAASLARFVSARRLSAPVSARRLAPSARPRRPPQLWRRRARSCSRAGPSSAPRSPRR